MLYCVLGNSGVGKTTIITEVIKEVNNLYPLILCTTRPKRQNEVADVDYYFMGDKIFSILYKDGLLFEERKYNVDGGNIWRYGTLLYDIEDAKERDYIVATSKTQFCSYYEYMKDYIVPIVLHIDDDARTQRALGRRGNTETESEIRRRIRDDIDKLDIDTIPIDFILLNYDEFANTSAFNISKMIEDFRTTRQYNLCGHEIDHDTFKLHLSILYNVLKGNNDES